MKRDKELLKEALEHHGWELISRYDENAWWAEEHWIVGSIRESRGLEVVVTFLVDPQYEGNDKSAAITYVAVNRTLPPDSITAEKALSEMRIADAHFSDAVERFVGTMDEFRSAMNDLKEIPRGAARGLRPTDNGPLTTDH